MGHIFSKKQPSKVTEQDKAVLVGIGWRWECMYGNAGAGVCVSGV